MVRTYDANKVVVVFGANILTGFADGSFLTVERSEDSFTVYVGSSGEVARSRSNNKTGTSTLKLMQTSLSNDILSAYMVADELSGQGIVPFQVKDLQGTTLVLAKESWVLKPADAEFAREAGEREWKIQHAELEVFIGGVLS
jgi:hypothetical protein